MVNVTDRVPQSPGQFILKQGGSTSTVTLTRDDNPVQDGTNINRELFMGIQGFIAGTTEFQENGNIVEENATGVLTTEFLSDGSIKQTFVGADGQTIIKTITFGADGNITEVLS